MSQLLEAALRYASHGWHVFPVARPVAGDAESGKRPHGMLGPSGGHHYATTREDIIRQWWAADPSASIGISVEPSGLVVLDVDVGTKKDGTPKGGKESLAEIAAHLPDTLAARTGSGGLHAIYTRESAPDIGRIIQFRPGLDLIGKGYIVAAPSPHYTGGAYEWISNAPVVPLPPFLVNVKRERQIAQAPSSDEQRAPLVEGGRNSALFRLGCALRDQGIGQEALLLALLGENAARVSPPLDEGEVRQITASVMRTVAHPSRDVAAGVAFADAVRAAIPPAPLVAILQADNVTPGMEDPGVALLLEDIAKIPRPPIRSYSTGNPQLDAFLGGGISTRQVAALCAPPAAGKSAFAIDVALRIEPTIPVLYVSTELEGSEVLARDAANIADLVWRDVVRGKVDDAVIASAVAGKRIHVIGSDKVPRDVPAALELIARTAIVLTQRYGVPPLIVIDFLQDLVESADDNVRGKVGDLARKLLAISQALDLPILAVCSVSREWYSPQRAIALREANDPTVYMKAAKESGGIDFSCAVILFLDADTTPTTNSSKPVRIVAAKARHGEAGFAGAQFYGASGRWMADPSAVIALSPEGGTGGAKSGPKFEARNAADDERVIAVMRELEARKQWPSKTGLRDTCGGNKGTTEQTIGRLLANGRLVIRDVTNPHTHRTDKNRITLPLEVAAPPAPSAPVASDPSLAGFLSGMKLPGVA